MKIVEKNKGKIPSKEQLLDAHVLPNWKKPKPSEAGWQVRQQQHRRLDDQTRRLDPVQAVSVFPARRDSMYFGGCDVAYIAVLDDDGASVEGASYQSSAAGVAPRSARSEGQEPIVVSDSDSDSDTSSDDSHLPFYLCSKCSEATVLGSGGTLLCATCQSRQDFGIRDSVTLLRLHTRGFNHQTGTIVGSVPREQDRRYRVLLTGETKAIVVRPVNLRPIYTVIFAPPGHQDKP